MGLLSGALEWWEEWQLRVLVLSSLCVQFLLFFTPWVRRVPCLRKFRVVVWMAYIGGDALAIYALASLFNRHHHLPSRTTRTDVVLGESSGGLEVLWTPVLLMHLGGHVTLSAFSLEDNELWLRHVITLVSQVTVALYVFCTWWSGELRLLLAAVMLFLFGILKFSLKPWAFRRASYSQMLASTDVSLSRGKKSCCSFAWWTKCTSNNRGARTQEKVGEALNLDQYVQRARVICESDQQATELPAGSRAIRYTDYFVDLSSRYSCRLNDLRYHITNTTMTTTTNASYKMLQKCFEDTYDLLYTRVGFTPIESVLVVFLPFLALASVVLFATSSKQGYSSRDVKVTYILFSCTTLLEFLLPLCGAIFLSIPCLKFLVEYLDGWHDMVPQYDLMSYYVRKKKPTVLMKILVLECLRKYVSKVWYVRPVAAAREITELVRCHIKEDGWKAFIRDAATYRGFSDLRGQLTLKKHQQQLGHGREVLWHSLKFPFDKSVLVWHMATRLCFYQTMNNASSLPRKRSTEMSDYMAYLLFIRTEMLLPGTRPGLFDVALYDLDDILTNGEANLPEKENEEALAEMIIQHTARASAKDTLIHEACRVAASLMEMQVSQDKRWEIIQGVWVEMLCYSASRCRGYLHAKSLGEGGEYLSYVWLLWSYMGMQTLADKIHKPESTAEIENFSTCWSHSGLNHQSSNGGIHSHSPV